MQPFTQGNFTVRDILLHEAKALSKHSPLRAEPREPESDFDPFTRLHNFGAGRCRVQQWPDDADPHAWGGRNETFLLDEPIHSPAGWEFDKEYNTSIQFNHLLGLVDHSHLRGLRVSDEGYEEQFLPVLNKILCRVTAVAFIFLIQLWRRNPEYTSHPDYLPAFEALYQFSVDQIRTSQRMSSRSRGIAIKIPQASYIQFMDKYEHNNEHNNNLVIGTVQRTGFAEKIHVANEHGCKTSDEVLSSILDDSDKDNDTNYLFKNFHLRSDWQLAPVGHIIQMSHLASLSASQMGFSTSIWGYLRFFIQVESMDSYAPILYITKNQATDTAWSDISRTDDSPNFKFLCDIYYFVILVLLKTHGPRILPPELRENDRLLTFFSSATNTRSNPFSYCWFLSRLALTWISKLIRGVWFNILAALWGLALLHCGNRVMEYVGSLKIQLIEGRLQRISEDEQIRGNQTLYVRFDSWDIRDVTEVGISQRAGLVLKVFHDHRVFESELRAYSVLQKAGVNFIPELLGIFNVPGTKGAMLCTMVGKCINELASLHDRRHLNKTIGEIHAANIHHHDLRLENIVRGLDGKLRIIDFGHSSPADECKAAELCPDQIFLDLWVR